MIQNCFSEETTQPANQLKSNFDSIIIESGFNIDAGSKNCNKFKQFADFCKKIYRNYKGFNAQDFLNDLETNLRSEEQTSTCVSYDKLTKIFNEITDKHAPQKKRKIRGN